jgi:hypothetical protein
LHPATLIEEFRALTGRALAWPALESLPESFRAMSVLSPGEILAAGHGRMSRRTVNTLRRYLTHGDPSGPWSYGRLIGIRGFGFMTLLEVLRIKASLPAHAQRRVPEFQQLGEEIDRLLARTHDPSTSTPTPALDRVVALIAGALPASQATIVRRLQSVSGGKAPLDLARLERALRFRDPPCPFVFLRRRRFTLVVAPHQLNTARLIHERSLRILTRRGALSVEQAGVLAGTNDLDFVRTVLSAHEEIEWLARSQQRCRLRPPARSAAA